MSVVELSKSIYLLRNEDARVGAFVEVVPSTQDTSFPSSSIAAGSGSYDGLSHIRWGAQDEKPSEMHRLATDSPNKWRLIETRRDFLIGNGVRFGIEKPNGAKMERELLNPTHKDYSAISDYIRSLDKVGYFGDAAYQASFSGNVFTGIPLDRTGRAELINCLDCFEMRIRALAQNESRVSAYIRNPNFGKRTYKKADGVPLPAFNPANPKAFPFSVFHAKHKLPGQPFYSFAAWWGTKAWTEVANQIPKYHLEGLTSGYNIKYLIKFPDDYFDREGLETEEEKNEHKRRVLNQMKESLAGKKDKAVVTYYKYDIQSMKALPGVEIVPLKNDMTDDAYVSLFNTANIAQASGHGVMPVLAGIDTGGKLGGSGKELEAAAMYQQKFMTYSDRALLLRPLIEVQDLNGWDSNIKFWFEDIEVYVTDSTPTNSPANPNNPAKQTNKDGNTN